MTKPLSTRAQIIKRRTYNRPTNEEGTKFETWEQTIDRCMQHQKWLWERAQGRSLTYQQAEELEELRQLLLENKVGLSGRTFWLGGTDIAQTREVSQFNCAFADLESVHDFVDLMWLLLNGVGVGFWPKPSTLNGFLKPIQNIHVVRSQRTMEQWDAGDRGADANVETWDAETKTWTIRVGDSAAAWAKAIGKLLAGKFPANTLVIDLSEIRAAGIRLRGYGWISSGDRSLSEAMEAIARLMSAKAGRLLSFADIHDIANWCGTVLSTRRSAQIALCDYGSPDWKTFATFKKNYWISNPQREQSNNSLVFWTRPTKEQLSEIFDLMLDAGGSEPGFINGAAARARAPWFAGLNPCGEILLPKNGFCNLVNVNLGAFKGDPAGLMRAYYIISRANYRQTCVDLRDGILQEKWHQNNQFLRLCGVSPTGQAMRPDLTPYDYRILRNEAIAGAYSMAVELNMPRPKNVTTGKPEGCRPETALVTTDQGIYQLSELLVGHPAETEWSRVEGKSVTLEGSMVYPVSRTLRNGKTPTKILKMSYGMEVQSTLNHPWWVEGRGWVETDEILPGDILSLRIHGYRNEVAAKLVTLDFTNRDARRIEIRQPEAMTDDLAWLMGYLWGNGCMSTKKGRFRFISQHRATLEKVQHIMQQQFRLSGANINRCGDRDAFVLDYASMSLMEWVKANGLFKYDADDQMAVIPVAIRASSWRHVIGFIAGLFDADGCVSTSGGRTKCILSTANGNFARHVQDVAAACGIVFGRSHNTKGANRQKGGKSIWLMNVSGRITDDALHAMVQASVKIGNSGWQPKRACKTLGLVEAVSEGGIVETFDVEVDEAHWFYAGAVKSHNTISKCMDATEGAHKPLARYILNNVAFSGHDPLVEILLRANYRVTEHPTRPGDYIIALPVAWDDVEFTRVGGLEVNIDSAVKQLEHYKMMMDNYIEQNQSITISYSPDEVPAIIDWLHENWDHYVGVSFLLRADPTKTAEDLGHPYLPQQPVTKAEYDAYVSTLLPVDIDADTGDEMLDVDDCSTGACPIR